jgi:hypothetical protein
MALVSTYVNVTGRIPDLFAKIRDGQAPDQFSQQLLKDWGFQSSNDRAFLPLLKALGFLSPDGKPTAVYHTYRDHSRSKIVMAEALRNSYQDIFLIKEHPTKGDRDAIQGKFKSYHNVSDNVASLMTKTFMALLDLADLSAASARSTETNEVAQSQTGETDDQQELNQASQRKPRLHVPSLHYDIQIHLPATKDVEVYNAIFKSLKGHLLDE